MKSSVQSVLLLQCVIAVVVVCSAHREKRQTNQDQPFWFLNFGAQPEAHEQFQSNLFNRLQQDFGRTQGNNPFAFTTSDGANTVNYQVGSENFHWTIPALRQQGTSVISSQPTNSNSVPTTTTTKSTCGQSSSTVPLILGGDLVEEGEYTWVAALYTRLGGSFRFACTSVIISERHVLTAAHCLRNIVPSQLRIIYTYNELLSTFNFSAFMPVERVSIHSGYEPGRPSHDIGLLTTTRAFYFNKFVSPICLPPARINRPNSGIIAGWGRTEDTNVSQKLRKLNMPLVGLVPCLQSNSELASIVTNFTFCAGKRDGRGPCFGDSGAPLFQQINGVYYIKGLVSTSLAKNNQCDLNNYVVFVDIDMELDWILRNMRF